VNLRNVRRVLAKELRETLRDRRTVMIMVVVPIFFYPVLLVVLEQLALFGRQQLEEAQATVMVIGADDGTRGFLARDSALRVETADSVPWGAVSSGEVDAAVVLDSPAEGDAGTVGARVLFDATRDRSNRARDVVRSRLGEWSDSLLARRLEAEGLPESFATPLAVADSSVASAERMGGYTLGRFLPMVLVLITLLGAFFPAIDLTAGEKERGTLEPLLTTPVPAREIVAGKFLTVTVLAVAAGALNLGSMLLTFESGIFRLAREAGLEFRLPLGTVLLLLLFLVPVAVLFAALFIGVAVRARSFKEAQNALTPIQLASMIPTYLPAIPGIPFSYGLALVPIGGIAVLFRELMAGGAPLGPAVVAVGSTVVYALLALRFAARRFGSEEILFGAGGSAEVSTEPWPARVREWRSQMQGVPGAAAALAFVAVVGLLYFYVGIRLQIAGREQGLFAAQWLLLAVPAVLFAGLGPYRVRSALALRPVPPRALAAAVLIIAGGIPVSWTLGWLQSLVLEIPEEFLRGFEALLRADTPARLLWLFVLIALTPAVCEELVFRGILLQGLSRELPMARAVIGSAVIFGAYHLSFETVIRFLPTAWLGLLLGYVAWNTRSIYPSMLMHALNNGAILLLVASTDLQAYLVGPAGEPKWIALPIAVVLLAAGVRLLPRRGDDPAPAGPLSEPQR
jgi:sodium transport system permease protein